MAYSDKPTWNYHLTNLTYTEHFSIFQSNVSTLLFIFSLIALISAIFSCDLDMRAPLSLASNSAL